MQFLDCNYTFFHVSGHCEAMTNLSSDEIRFHQAIESGSVSDLQKILKKITNSRDDEQRTPLHKAVTKADTEMVEYLIDNCGAESKYDFSTGSSITPIPTLCDFHDFGLK